MAEVLKNIKWTFKNKSNFELDKETLTTEIIDIPYYPAQNYVNFEGNLDIYSDICVRYFTDGTTLFGFYEPEIKEQRFTLIAVNNGKRYFIYRYKEQDFPQYRDDFSLTYDNNNVYIFGGFVNDRCMQDLWIYNIAFKSWENRTPLFPESENWAGRRKYGSLFKKDNYLYLFGGMVDVIIGQFENQAINWITLNDLWQYDLDASTWIQYDLQSFLPREIGKIVYVDNQYLHIAFADKIVIYDLVNDTIYDTITGLSNPIDNNSITFFKNNKYYLLTSNKTLYEYNPYSYIFTQKQTNILAVSDNGLGFKYYVENKHFGNVSYTRIKKDVFCPKLIDIETGNEVEKYDINVFPAGYITNYCYIGDKKIFAFSGVDYIDNQYRFYEENNGKNTWIYNGNTNQTELIDTQPNPSERIYASLCYDEDRNCIWMFGGWDGANYYNDLWKFDLNTKQWVKINYNQNNDEIPENRRKCGICYLFNRIYIIGGENESETFNDFWYFNLEDKKWYREYPVDKIPFGTENILFKYKNRLYFFNGDLRHLYRYYYSYKQFVQVGLDTSHYDVDHPINILRNNKLFLVSPLETNVIGNRLFIFGYYPYTNGLSGGKCNLVINLETKEVIDLTDANPYHKLDAQYLTPISEIELISTNPDTNLSHYFLNFSELVPFTKNQIPHSDGIKIGNNAYGKAAIAEINNQIYYIDKHGMFTIEKWYETDLSGRDFSKVTDSTSITLDEINEINQNLDATSNVLLPQFLYSMKSLNYNNEVTLPIIYAWESNERIYVVGGNGNILRFNPNDGTMFRYFSQLWKDSAIGIWKNIIYCFGGYFGGWPAYDQNGLPCPQTISVGENGEKGFALTHNGFLKFDLNYNTFQVNYLQTIPDKIERIDYEIIKQYLTDLALDFLTNDLDKQTIEDVKDNLYLQTQNIIADLSRRQIIYETGERPSARAKMGFCQIDNKLYIVGGAFIYSVLGLSGNSKTYYQLKNDLYCYDMDEQKWTKLTSCPIPIMDCAFIYDGNDRIYLIGGWKNYTSLYQNMASYINNDIYYYQISTNSWHKLYYLPASFRPRAKPNCFRVNDKIIIIYGVQEFKIKDEEGNAIPIEFPIDDIWVLDLTKEIIYKVIDEYPNEGLIIQNNLDENDRYFQILPAQPKPYKIVENRDLPDLYLRLYTFDLVTKEFTSKFIIPDAETMYSYYGMINPETGEVTQYSPPTKYLGAFYHKGILYILGSYIHSNLHTFRFYWIDYYNVMRQIVVDVPILTPPKVAVYDNNRFLYVFWNGYNLWRLDMDNLNDPNAWLRLPPNPDIEKSFIDITHAFWNDLTNEIIFCSKGGTVLKYNPDTNKWLLLSREIWSEDLYADDLVLDRDGTLYYFKEKSLYGKYYDTNLRQYHQFYFDMLKLRFKHNINMNFDYIPALIKRNKLLTSNWCGHINYNWIKIVGKFDIYINFDQYVRSHSIKVYGDDYVLNNPSNCKLIITTKNGKQTLTNPDVVINDPEWEFDNEFYRRYKKYDIQTQDWIYTTKPPNYLKFDIPKPIKDFELFFTPAMSEMNYTAHINAVEVHNLYPYLIFTENGNQIFSITIEPFETEESAIYTVTVKNISSVTVYDIKTYIYKNKNKVLFSKYGNEWKFANVDDPLDLVDHLYPNISVSFLIKVKNFDKFNPIKLDLVVTGKTASI